MICFLKPKWLCPNYIRALLNPVEKGYDPVPRPYAEDFARLAWDYYRTSPDYYGTGKFIDMLETRMHGLQGKRVLDLGGGPGQLSVGCAKRGAAVVWHDVSRNYAEIAQAHASEEKVPVEFSLGYMEEAVKFGQSFDLLLNVVCWCYCWDDAYFAEVVFKCLKPGGYGFVDNYFVKDPKFKPRLYKAVNDIFGVKYGIPAPPPGRIVRLLKRYPVDIIFAKTSSTTSERIFFQRKR